MIRRDHLVAWPSEVRELFSWLTGVRVQGIMLPGLGRVFRWKPRLAFWFGERLDFFPLNHLCNQILVMGEKPGA